MRTRTRTLAAAGALAALLAVPAASPAATYTQHVCHKPDGSATGRDGFGFGVYGKGVSVADTCSSGHGGGLVAQLPYFGPGGAYDPRSYAQWIYRVPSGSGLTVKQLRMGRGADGMGNGIRFSVVGPDGVDREGCNARPGNPGAVCPSFGSKLTLNDLGVGFQVGVFCPDSGSCSQPFADRAPEGRVDHVEIDLEDSSPPQITNSPAGTGLFNSGSPRAGSQLVSYSAADAGGGLYRAILRVDGRDFLTRAIDPNDGRCEAPFVHQVPCKTGPVNDSFSVDTTQIPDGQHQVQLIVRDATGVNQAASGPVEIVVDNVPPPSPEAGNGPRLAGSPQVGSELTAQPGSWSGTGTSFSYQWLRCDADAGGCVELGTGTSQRYTVTSRDAEHRLRVRVTGTNAEGSTNAQSDATPVIVRPADANPAPRTPDPIVVDSPGARTPNQDRGAANGQGASDRVQLSAFFGRGRTTTVRARYGRSARITGRLLGPNERPISDATLTVLSQSRAAGAELEEVGTVRTDRDGGFSYTVAAGPSRMLRFAYRSHAGDTQYADTTDVLVLVQAGVTLKASPRKLRNGNVGTFRGRAVQPLPARGVLVDLQARVGKQWRTFAVVRTSGNGKYRYRHRFRNTFVATKFKFRARIHRQADYPYIVGYSRTATLRVRP